MGFRPPPTCDLLVNRINISLCLICNDSVLSQTKAAPKVAPMDQGQLAFPALTATLKAAAEATRLRILALIAESELTVSDLTDILRQSQPRLSRHLRLLAAAGLVERLREGSWAFFRLRERGSAADIARALIARLDAGDPVIARDR